MGTEMEVVTNKITIIDSYEDVWVQTGLKLNDLILDMINKINSGCTGPVSRYHYHISGDERIELIHALKRECSREVWKSNCKHISKDNVLYPLCEMMGLGSD
jgi:hypothetical protein